MSVITNVPVSDIPSPKSAGSNALFGWLQSVYLICFSLQQSGTTAQRPTKSLWIGRFYFDTDLTKPIWVKQVTPSVLWCDATGTTV